MSNKPIKYTKGEMGRMRVVKDFLPAPDDLGPRDNNKLAAKSRRLPDPRVIRTRMNKTAEKKQ